MCQGKWGIAFEYISLYNTDEISVAALISGNPSRERPEI